MNQIDGPLKDLSEIRTMMERSSKFLSLSGLAGVSAGAAALAGAAAAYWKLGLPEGRGGSAETALFLACDAGIVLIAAIGLAIFFTTRMAKKIGHPVWSGMTKYLLAALLIPLAAGGVVCLAAWSRGWVMGIGPFTLVFYGLALLNCSKYTVREIQYLGIAEIVLGLTGLFFADAWLLLWAAGFGALHIVYGILMYVKYEK
ncbi:MAG TPA: hypothetical protein VI215_02435 [Bacteroidota bacterium]|jgi:hypothetical protein